VKTRLNSSLWGERCSDLVFALPHRRAPFTEFSITMMRAHKPETLVPSQSCRVDVLLKTLPACFL
jgi:hypothetical protein